MKEEWKETTIGELCTIKSGTTVKKVLEESAGNVPYVKVADMNNEGNEIEIVSSSRFLTEANVNPKSLFPVGTTIFPKRGGAIMTNKKRLTSIPICCDLNIMGVIPPSTVHPQYLFYYFENVDMRGLGSGTTIPQINNYDIEPLSIFVPEFETQKRIVAILDEAFGAIARAKENAARNLANARELFDSYLNRVFTEAWENNKLVNMAELATDITDGNHNPPPKTETGLPFITISNIDKTTRKIDFSNTFKVSREYYDDLKPNRKPRKNDVLYTVTGSFGIPVLIDYDDEFCFQRHIGLIRPKEDVDSKWLYYLCLTPQVFGQASEGATGTAQKTVSLKVLRTLKVPRVEYDKQITVVPLLDKASQESAQLQYIYQQKIVALDELKQSLLQKAFTGQLTSKTKELELVP